MVQVDVSVFGRVCELDKLNVLKSEPTGKEMVDGVWTAVPPTHSFLRRRVYAALVKLSQMQHSADAGDGCGLTFVSALPWRGNLCYLFAPDPLELSDGTVEVFRLADPQSAHPRFRRLDGLHCPHEILEESMGSLPARDDVFWTVVQLEPETVVYAVYIPKNLLGKAGTGIRIQPGIELLI